MKPIGTLNERLNRTVRCTCGWKGKFSDLVSPNPVTLEHLECPKCQWTDWEFCLSVDEVEEMRKLKQFIAKETLRKIRATERR